MTKVFVIFLLLFNIYHQSSGFFQSPDKTTEKQCFCELKGNVDDCSCSVDTVDYYNNVKIFPRLKSLLQSNYFRFYKVNLHNDCPFWKDVDFECAMRFCHVKPCEEKDLPVELQDDDENSKKEAPHDKYMKENQHLGCKEDYNKELDLVNKSISEKQHEELQKWSEHDEAQGNFCVLDDHQEKAEYVDLTLNPERFTGYQGRSAHRIWQTIYKENCFKSPKISKEQTSYNKLMKTKVLMETCLEERVFYRMVSGLHASINVHLAANFLQTEKDSPMGLVSPNGHWGPNLKEFVARFSPETTYGEGEKWLRNLYFAYLVELRAIAKVAPYLRNEEFFTGIENSDKEVRLAINDLLNVIEAFPSHFDESIMFNGVNINLKNEFREKFLNISRIMDCVGCDKCRLWGKLQTQGMGTALKILFSGKFEHNTLENNVYVTDSPIKEDFKMRRSEIVALFNAFGRLSSSIYFIELFRNQLR